jgi:hypothetical protein
MGTESVGRFLWMRKSWLAISLALACAISAGSANAVIPVEDIPHTIQNIITQLGTQAKHVAEYSAQAQRWAQQYQHMQQQLIRLEGFMTASMSMPDSFEERPDDHGIEQCGGDGSVTSWAERFIPDPNGEITSQQLKVCQKLVQAENRKYNETVKVLKDLRDRAAEFQTIEGRRRAVGSSEGNMDVNDNDVARFSTRVQMDLEYWQAMMTAYDSYIGLLNSEQQRLAIAAMRGKKKVLGTVVQGVVLKGALETARSRDR